MPTWTSRHGDEDGDQDHNTKIVCGKGIVYLQELIPGERRYKIVNEFGKPVGPIYVNNINPFFKNEKKLCEKNGIPFNYTLCRVLYKLCEMTAEPSF